ncbi:hypothetical protein Hanom_Chr14g01249501 [Helianthus anomalus]
MSSTSEKEKRDSCLYLNVNPLDENLNLIDASKVLDKYLTHVVKSLYDKVGNKSGIVSRIYDHDRNLWIIT